MGDIDKNRIEKRIGFKQCNEALQYLLQTFHEIEYSENKYTQNLIFDDENLNLTKRLRIKARRYCPDGTIEPVSLDDIYLLDFKIEENGTSAKERTEGKVGDLIEYVNEKANMTGLRPRHILKYKRMHLISDKFPNTRITVDSEINYYILDENLNFTKSGSEDFLRFEFKYQESHVEFEKYIKEVMEKFEGYEANSKREQAQFFGKQLTNK